MTQRRATVAFVLALMLAATLPPYAHAMSLSSVMVRTGYRSWSPGEDAPDLDVSQAQGSMTLGARIAAGTQLLVAVAGADSRMAGGASLSGMTSVSAASLTRLADERLLIKLNATLPSGKRSLDAAEFQVAQAIGHPLLGFGVRHYGTGFEGGGSASWELSRSPGRRFTAGAGFLVRGPYDLVADADTFHPGPEYALTAGWDGGEEGAAGGVSADLTWRGFGTDRVGGDDVFREGAQLEIRVRALTERGRNRASAVATGVLKSQSTSLAPGGAVVAETKAQTGDGLGLRLGLDREISETLRLGIALGGDGVTGSEVPGRNGTLFVAGARAERTLGAGWSLDLNAGYGWGSMDSAVTGTRVATRGFSTDLGVHGSFAMP